MQNNELEQKVVSGLKELDLRVLLNILLKGKKLISFTVIFFSLFALIYSISLPNVYKSTTILTPVEDQDSFSGALESFSGLAGLTGLDLSIKDSISIKAIEKLNSLSFFEKNIMPNIFLPELMALDSWNSSSNKLNFDKDTFDQDSNTWVRSFTHPNKQIPSAQESFEVFKKKHLLITENSINGFITLEIKHQSPYVAYEWTKLMVSEINSFYREKDKTEAEISIRYLNKQLAKTSLSEIKQALAELLQIQIQKLTLIEAKEAYVFDYIDPPVVMERKAEPNRIIISLIGIIFGFILGSLIVIVRFFKKN